MVAAPTMDAASTGTPHGFAENSLSAARLTSRNSRAPAAREVPMYAMGRISVNQAAFALMT